MVQVTENGLLVIEHATELTPEEALQLHSELGDALLWFDDSPIGCPRQGTPWDIPPEVVRVRIAE